MAKLLYFPYRINYITANFSKLIISKKSQYKNN